MKQMLYSFYSAIGALIAFCAPLCAWGQPSFEWDRTIGWEGWEDLNALELVDDGIILAGSSSSVFTFDRTLMNDWSQNYVVVKLGFDGTVLWQKMYGGGELERLWKLIPTSDGGFLMGGESFSGASFEKTEPNRGKEDFWLVKTDADGNKLWDKTFGGDTLDALFAIRELPGGGYLIGGNSYSNKSGDKTEDSRGDMDWWLLRLDPQGNKIWDKTFGGDFYDQLNDIELAPDGDVYVSGGTRSKPGTGEVGNDPEWGNVDFWLMKLDPITGQKRWDRRFGGINYDFPYALCVAKSGIVYLGGPSQSPPVANPGHSGGKTAPFYGFPFDGWVVKVDATGKKIGEFSYGGSSQDEIYFIQEDISGSGRLVVGGFTSSPAGAGTRRMPSKGSYDYWMQGIEADGSPRWELVAGGSEPDVMYYFAQLPTGAYLLGGTSLSPKGLDKSEDIFKAGFADFWILRTSCGMSADIVPQGNLEGCAGTPLSLKATAQNCKNCTFEWSTGDIAEVLEIAPGTTDSIRVIARDNYNCFAYDSVFVNIGALPQIDLGVENVRIIRGESLRVGGVEDPSLSYAWNTGATTPSILVSREGIYAVTVTDPQGCSGSDTLTVSEAEASVLWAPNAFSPNGDGLHDGFGVFVDETIVKQVLLFQVGDRWGNLLYSLRNFTPVPFETEWEGVANGQKVDPGVYIWFAEVELTTGRRLTFKGNVTVVR